MLKIKSNSLPWHAFAPSLHLDTLSLHLLLLPRFSIQSSHLDLSAHLKSSVLKCSNETGTRLNTYLLAVLSPWDSLPPGLPSTAPTPTPMTSFRSLRQCHLQCCLLCQSFPDYPFGKYLFPPFPVFFFVCLFFLTLNKFPSSAYCSLSLHHNFIYLFIACLCIRQNAYLACPLQISRFWNTVHLTVGAQ